MNTTVNLNILVALANHICNFKEFRELAKTVRVQVRPDATYYTATNGHSAVLVRDELMSDETLDVELGVESLKRYKMPKHTAWVVVNIKDGMCVVPSLLDIALTVAPAGTTPKKVDEFFSEAQHTSGMAARIDPSLLLGLEKCYAAIQARAYIKPHLVLEQNGLKAASYSGAGFFGIVMPMRATAFSRIENGWVTEHCGTVTNPQERNLKVAEEAGQADKQKGDALNYESDCLQALIAEDKLNEVALREAYKKGYES